MSWEAKAGYGMEMRVRGWQQLRIIGLALILLAGVFLLPAVARAECTTTWVGPVEGTWSTAANWSTKAVPTSADIACIGAGGSAKVNTAQKVAAIEGEGGVKVASSGSLELTRPPIEGISTIGSFSLTGGVLSGPGTVHVTSSFKTGGINTGMVGTGKTVVKAGATAELNQELAGGSITIERNFLNEGDLTFSKGNIHTGSGAVIENTGTFVANSQPESVSAFRYSSGAAPSVVNSGTFEKTAGSGSTVVAIKFENKGTVRAKTGTLSFSGGGSSGGAGSWIGTESGQLTFPAGSFTWTESKIAGTAKVNGATVTAEALEGPAASLWLSSGTLSFGGASSTVSSFTLNGGTQMGSGTLNVTSSFNSGGVNVGMAGSGKTVLAPGVTAEIKPELSGSTFSLTERTLVNEGTLTFTDGNIRLGSAATIENKGTFRANSEPTSVTAFRYSSGGTGAVVNTGAFEKTAGSGQTTVGVNFENKGSVQGNGGTLSFQGGGSSNSAAEWAGGAGQVSFPSGSFTWIESEIAGNVRISGATVTGEALEGPSSNLSLNSGSLSLGGSPSALSSFTLTGGTLTGAGTLNITSSFNSGGSNVGMTGTGKTVLKPGATGEIDPELSGGTFSIFERTLVNEGTLTFTDGNIRLGSAATIENKGTFRANSEPTSVTAFRYTSGGSGRVVNVGSFEKTTGTGNTNVGVEFENKGSIAANTGELTFSGGGFTTATNSWTAAEGAKIIFAGSYTIGSGSSLAGNFDFTNGTVVANAGLVNPATRLNVGWGNLSVSGGPLKAEHLSITNGTVTLGAASEASSVSSFTLTGGTLTGAGTLNITSSFNSGGSNVGMTGTGKTVLKPGATGEIDPELSGGTFSIFERTLVNEGTLTFTDGNIRLGSAATIENKGTFRANSEPTSVTAFRYSSGAATGVFVNAGSLEKTAGTGNTVVDVDFANYGSVDNKSGKLVFERPVAVDWRNRFGNRAECADPVDCATGDFFESQTDLAVGGLGIGLILTRTYSARGAAAASTPGAFGYGWTHSFGDRLVSEESGKKATFIAADGTRATFTGGPGAFSPPAWSQQTLSGNAETGYLLTQADQTELAFSGSGRLESVTDRNGNATTLSYNGLGQLTVVADPAGREMKLAYNGGGQVESVKDPMGDLIKYAYESGHLAKVTMPGEESPRWQFKYDGSHRMTTMTDGRGGKTTNEYDASNRVKSQTDPAERTFKFEYMPFHTKVTNQMTGTVTDQWFTSNNQPYSVTYAFGTASARTETFEYDEGGRLVAQTDPAGHTTTYTYNAAGDRTSVKDPAGNETKWTYNGTHDVLTATAPGGLTTTIVRDAAGNPETVSRPAPGGGTQATSFGYDEDGQLESLADPLERTWEFAYNGNGDLVAETNPEGEAQTWTYDENSQLATIVSPRGNEESAEPAEFTTTIGRNPQGRPVKVTDPLGHFVEYGYDGNGNVDERTDPNGHTTTYFYNAVNEPTKTEKPNGDTTEAAYDGEGQVVSQTNGNEDTTTYVRNVLGQVTEVVDPLERKRSFGYDLAGNLETVVDQAGRETTYAYDNDDRVTAIDYSSAGTADVSFEYDADGNVIEMVDGSGESSFEYDVLGRLVKAEDGHGDSVEYDYNLVDEQTGITYPNGKSISRTFDGAGRLTSVSDWLGGTTTFAYDADSNLEQIVFPAGTGRVDRFGYDAGGMVSDVTFEDGGEPQAAIDYTRDKAAQIEAIVTEGLPGAAEQEFGYDENGRLAGSSAGSYEYDGAGYLVKTPTAANVFNAAGELEAGGGITYDYNAMGERTEAAPESGPATTYGYDQAGGLTSVQRAGEGEAPALGEGFAYDGTRLAISQTVGESTRYLTWDVSGGPPLLLADDNVSYLYGPGGLPIAHIDSEEAPTYYHHDQLGSTRILSDAAGESIAAFSYQPYGALEASSGAGETPFGYAGQYTAAESGLQYLRARFYDPATAQFVTEDPLAAITGEPYGYGAGNPLSYVDRTGLGPCVLGFIACDEDDDPCDSLATGPMLPACLIPQEAAPTVTNVSAGAGDSLLSIVPGTDPGPWLRDQLGINNVSECSAAYRFSKGFVDWVSMTKGIANGAEYVGRHYPDIVKAGRDMSRRQSERTVHLPPEIMP